MGKASKWFRGLLGLKSSGAGANQSQNPRRKWSFTRKDGWKPPRDAGDDASKHAVAVAAATAAAAEAAVAAAQAAAAVVQLTSSGRNISSGSCTAAFVSRGREEKAAVMIQSHFRAYLARRALRALKALVKLQALVRGHLVRKETAYALARLQALVRAQVRARAGRVLVSESPYSSMKPSHYNYSGPGTPEKFEHDVTRARTMKHDEMMMLKRNRSKSSCSVNFAPEKSRLGRPWMDNRMGEGGLWEQGVVNRIQPLDDDQSDKILEVDTGHKHSISKRRSLFYSSHLSLGSDKHCQSFSTSKDSTAHCQSLLSPPEVQSMSTMNYTQDGDESAFCTADNSPTFNSISSRGGSSKRGAFTPAKSDGSRSFLSSYSDHPNYMTYTESSKAKVRSQSAPKQRPLLFERLGSTKRYSVHAHSDSRSAQKGSTNRVYQGSGHLDRCGMPIRGDSTGLP